MSMRYDDYNFTRNIYKKLLFFNLTPFAHFKSRFLHIILIIITFNI